MNRLKNKNDIKIYYKLETAKMNNYKNRLILLDSNGKYFNDIYLKNIYDKNILLKKIRNMTLFEIAYYGNAGIYRNIEELKEVDEFKDATNEEIENNEYINIFYIKKMKYYLLS